VKPTLRHAIARIDIVQGERSLGHGTGCLVTPDLVLTAMHVVADRKAAGLSPAPGVIVLTFPTHRTEAAIVEGRWDQTSDWTLLRCASPPPGVHPVPLADSVADGDEWETFGFPDANSRDGMAQLGTVDNAAGTFEGVAAHQLFSRQAAAGVGAPVKGLSGGPVIVGGALAGVFRASLMREGQFNVAGTLYACPVETILARCDDLLPIPDPCRGLPGLPRSPLPAAPYRFLERFTARDAEIFFGRNREIRELYDRVTSEGGAPVVLLYGQSGAGKSSFLDAGLLPRLASTSSAIYVRRDRNKGLLRTLVDALVPALPGVGAQSASRAPAEALRLAWLGTETATARPLVVVVDQVEEAFTLPSADANELGELVDALSLFQGGPADAGHSVRPRGRLVLAFRKEWLGEVQKQLDRRGIDYSKVFLEALDAEAVVEIVTGLERTRRLRERYGLTVEASLPAAIARDLTADAGSPVAPMLQVLLSRMWREAAEVSAGTPQFTAQLYARVTREGFLLTDFLDHQLAALTSAAHTTGGSVTDVAESGLALDVLRFHVSPLGTAEERTNQELVDEYHRDGDVAWLVGELKRLYLLSEPADDGSRSAATRLAHDTLAAAIRVRCDESVRPGQRARRILEGRAGEWTEGRTGTPLDSRDLALVEQGLTGMRVPRADEARLIGESRTLRTRDAVKRRGLRLSALAAAAVVLIAAGVAWSYYQQTISDRAWGEMVNLDAMIPTLLLADSARGLVVAIDVVDRSLEANDGVLMSSVEEHLALALDQGRERFVWTLPARVISAAMSGDGRVTAGTDNGTIHVYRLDTPGAMPQVIQGAGDGVPVSALSFSDDGELLAAAMGRQGISVWRRNGDRVADLPRQPAGDAVSVRFAPGSHTMVAAFADATTVLHVVDIDTGTADTRVLQGKPIADPGGLAVVTNAAKQVLVATVIDKRVELWTVEGRAWSASGDWRRGRTGDVRAVAMTLDADGHVLMAEAASTGRVKVWNLDGPGSWQEVPRPGPNHGVIAFGAGGRTVLVGAADGLVRVYDRMGRAVVAPFSVGDDVGALAVAPDGELAAVSGTAVEARLRIIDTVGLGVPVSPLGRLMLTERTGLDPPGALAFVPRSGQLIVAGPDEATRIWSLDLPRGASSARGREVATLVPDTHFPVAVAVDTDGRTIAIIGNEQGLRLVGPDGSPAEPLFHHGYSESAIAVSPDGTTAVVGYVTGHVAIWDVATRRVIKAIDEPAAVTIGGDTNTVWKVAFAEDGQLFAAAFRDGRVRIYRRDGSQTAQSVQPAGVQITALMFVSGQLVTGSNHGEVQILDVSGKRQQALRAFAGAVIRDFAWHANDRWLFVASSQGLRVLDFGSGHFLDLLLPDRTADLHALTISPDGRLLAARGQGGRFIFWRVGWEEWLAEACERLRGHELFALANPGATDDTVPGAGGIAPYRAFDACTRRVWNAK
jgi:WD40 repeat protein